MALPVRVSLERGHKACLFSDKFSNKKENGQGERRNVEYQTKLACLFVCFCFVFVLISETKSLSMAQAALKLGIWPQAAASRRLGLQAYPIMLSFKEPLDSGRRI